jgi:acetate kinase
MNILVVNSGSSSVKFQLFDMPQEILLMKGKAVKNEHNETEFQFHTPARTVTWQLNEFSYGLIFKTLFAELVNPLSKCLDKIDEIDVIGHRLIHGGKNGTGCREISDELVSFMESSVPLAPLHYPANLEGIRTLQHLIPGILQAGVFDTAFHSTLPQKAYLYGISPDWCHQHHIRRYGFHGISHKYASEKACELAGLSFPESKIVSCHLGNGASVAAVKNGKSIDTSMGFTPVEGLIMGSRSGDIDAGVLIHLMENHQFSASDIRKLINKQGGLLGLSGVSSDYRAVEEAAETGNMQAQTALDIYHYRVKKYIGAYAAALGGIDLLVFTGGTGENSSRAREEICSDLGFLGINLKPEYNSRVETKDSVISRNNSPVAVVAVAANEELEIAREVSLLVASR